MEDEGVVVEESGESVHKFFESACDESIALIGRTDAGFEPLWNAE